MIGSGVAATTLLLFGFSAYKMSADIVRARMVILAHAVKNELIRKEKQKLRHRKVSVKSWIGRVEEGRSFGLRKYFEIKLYAF